MDIADCVASRLTLLASAQRRMVSMTRPRGEQKASRLGDARLAVTLTLLVLPTLLGTGKGRRPGGGLLSLPIWRGCALALSCRSRRGCWASASDGASVESARSCLGVPSLPRWARLLLGWMKSASSLDQGGGSSPCMSCSATTRYLSNAVWLAVLLAPMLPWIRSCWPLVRPEKRVPRAKAWQQPWH